MTDGFLLYKQDESIVTLTMSRPATRNALSGEGEGHSFEQACARVNGDLEVRCVILTGAGDAFCSGGNVKDMLHKRGLSEGRADEVRHRYRTGIQRIPLALYGLEVPTIAAVNGAAYGAGCDIAAMCDIRIASSSATFAESFVKLGIISGDGGAWFLPRAIGMSRAAEMTFTAEAIDAETAKEWGLVSRVVSNDRLMDESLALAKRIAVHPGSALRMAKSLLRHGQRVQLETLLEMTAAYQAIAHRTPDHELAMQTMFRGEG